MNSYPWFRFYSEALNDRKILRACRTTGQPKAVVMGLWVTMLCLANDSPDRGRLLISDDLPVSDEELQLETGIDPMSLSRIIEAFMDLSMLSKSGCYEIVNWEERQRKSDYSNERVQAHRARKRAEKQDVTLPKRYSNGLEEDIDKEREEERESERIPPPEYIPEKQRDLINSLCLVTNAHIVFDEIALGAISQDMASQDVTPAMLEGFPAWWEEQALLAKKNGKNYPYRGKPSLKSLVRHWDEYLSYDPDAELRARIPAEYADVVKR